MHVIATNFTHTYKLKIMIWRISRVGNLVRKNICNSTFRLPRTPSSHIILQRNTLFTFSQENKKPKPSNNKDDDESIEADMKAEGEKSNIDDGKNKIAQEDMMKPTRFGNTMLLISALALALAYAYMQIQVIRVQKKKKPQNALAKITGVGKAQIGGEWKLIGTDGLPFSNKNLEGTYYLIYFGFTHCPDICPTSLTKLSRAVARVKKSKQANFFNLKTIFVSVDPDRDNAQKIVKFIKTFDPEIIGVTGLSNEDPALRDCMRQFKIYASKLQFQQGDETLKGRKSYTIDHTILTYLMSDTNEYLAHLGANMGEHDLSTLILQKITEDKREKLRHLKL